MVCSHPDTLEAPGDSPAELLPCAGFDPAAPSVGMPPAPPCPQQLPSLPLGKARALLHSPASLPPYFSSIFHTAICMDSFHLRGCLFWSVAATRLGPQ